MTRKHLSGTRELTMNLPELGVGLTFFPGLEPVLESNEALINLVEIEPQSLWRREGNGPTVIVDEPSLKLLHDRALPNAGSQRRITYWRYDASERDRIAAPAARGPRPQRALVERALELQFLS